MYRVFFSFTRFWVKDVLESLNSREIFCSKLDVKNIIVKIKKKYRKSTRKCIIRLYFVVFQIKKHDIFICCSTQVILGD